MLRQLRDTGSDELRRRVLGDGLTGELAARGIAYLGENVREAIDHPDERLTSVRLEPGDEFTVVARPPATRVERKLADRERRLRERRQKVDRPSRAQLRTARRLEKVQRRIDRRRPGSRRARRLVRRESRLAARFDRVMAPTKQQVKVHTALERVSSELAERRATSLAHARARRGRKGTRPRVTVYE